MMLRMDDTPTAPRFTTPRTRLPPTFCRGAGTLEVGDPVSRTMGGV